MTLWALLYLILYFNLVGLIVYFGYLLQRNKEVSYEANPKGSNPDGITLLIPFRNERHRIAGLLSSINGLKTFPHKILFIDDRSEDGTGDFIRETLQQVPYEILTLTEGESGKKRALRAGMLCVKTEFTLTWDADLTVKPDYFERLALLAPADLYVLPVAFCPQSFAQKIYEMDVLLANAVNVGWSGWKRPIFASGANLLYRTAAFAEVDSYEQHKHIASGDDTFLLRDFVTQGKDVRVSTDLEHAITTETPQSFREYIDQRLRWVSKTQALHDPINSITAVGQAILALLFFALIIASIVLSDWNTCFVVLFGKCAADLLLFYPYFKRIGRLQSWMLIPLYELWFPFYSLLLLVLVPIYKPHWKGRKIQNR